MYMSLSTSIQFTEQWFGHGANSFLLRPDDNPATEASVIISNIL